MLHISTSPQEERHLFKEARQALGTILEKIANGFACKITTESLVGLYVYNKDKEISGILDSETHWQFLEWMFLANREKA